MRHWVELGKRVARCQEPRCLALPAGYSNGRVSPSDRLSLRPRAVSRHVWGPIYGKLRNGIYYRGRPKFSAKESLPGDCSMRRSVNGTENTDSGGQFRLVAASGFFPK